MRTLLCDGRLAETLSLAGWVISVSTGDLASCHHGKRRLKIVDLAPTPIVGFGHFLAALVADAGVEVDVAWLSCADVRISRPVRSSP